MAANLSHPPLFQKMRFEIIFQNRGDFVRWRMNLRLFDTKNKTGNYSVFRTGDVNELHVSCFRINVSNLLVPRVCL